MSDFYAVTRQEFSFTEKKPMQLQRKLFGYVIGGLLIGSIATPELTFAQEQSKKTFSLDTVVVTARNREESAQKVPLPVSVVGGKTLDRDNIVSVNDLVKKIPNLGVFGSNPRQTSISLRGIGKNAANDTMEPSVGVIVDGVVSSYVGQSWNDFIDLDRIEVIRGPQGTLLGKNTTLGVVNIVTKGPSFKPGYNYEVRYGDYNELGGKVSGTGAIVDDLIAYRGSLFFNKKDGVLDNVWQSGPETWNETNRVGGRLQFLVTPDETLSARIILDSIQSVENGNKSLLVDNGPAHLRMAKQEPLLSSAVCSVIILIIPTAANTNPCLVIANLAIIKLKIHKRARSVPSRVVFRSS